MTNEDRLKDLLNIEEKNDIFNLTREERGVFQNWVKKLLEKEESVSAGGELAKVMNEVQRAKGREVIFVSAEGEYIKKSELVNRLEDFNKWCKDGRLQGSEFALCVIHDLPTYSFPDREKGEWITKYEHKMCNKCGHTPPDDEDNCYILSNFCPNCGADMRGDKAE